MMKKLILIMTLLISTVATAQTTSSTSDSQLIQGVCANGAKFMLRIDKAFYADRKGNPVNKYTYSGALGEGTIASNATPEQAKRFVCRETTARWQADDSPIDE
jgi:ABC-type transporter MlaC component